MTAESTASALEQRVLAALARVIDPEIRRPVTELDMIDGVHVATDDAGATRAEVQLRLTIVGCPAADRIERDVRTAASSVEGIDDVAVDVGVMDRATRDALIDRLRGDRPRGHPFTPDALTRVIAVTSGKGGVGKSTVTANLAVALAQRGLRVGLMDADVFGFSIPGILGIADAKPTRVGEMIMPPRVHGLAVISIGMFVDPHTSVSWRGPMLHRTVEQFLTDVYFGDLDVLVIDMPPGTGDVAISIGQLLPHAEVLVVTTPQKAAADVAERSALVARQTGQTVIGVVENMTGYVQPDGSVLELFGSGGGDETAARLDVDVLARVPLSLALREGGDAGRPIVLRRDDAPGETDAAAQAILDLADRVIERGRGLAGRPLTVTPR
ncbi:MAG: Mrp/NBP35 family ATP-binding protein [Actinobacteria bacterium]|nr:Mrp/NBP35 family ATP-binding protein [Actinomycetota bacterium]MBU1607856.1 Mrp/NBP35 family ATP-binding protein [Actinomycetota bacterium]MBU2314710.1 Mrp/NBP35 family ATP-binding protein [Actinomycetota bacterium]MBU2385981.1 Mrp/NBP35 family ATP-binding protein [Actinomycetota bacterium]